MKFIKSIASAILCVIVTSGYSFPSGTYTNTFVRNGTTYVQRGQLKPSDYVVTNVNVTAESIDALPLTGGTLTGDLAVGDEHTASRKLTVAADIGANGITLQGGAAGTGSSVTIGGSDGIGGTFTVSGGAVGGGKITVEASDTEDRGGSIEVQGNGASIKKDGKEVATESYVDAKVENAVLPTNQTFSNAVLSVGLNIDTNSVAVLNEIASTFGGFPIEGTATTVGGLLAALAAAAAWLKKNKADKATTLAGYCITDAATMASLAPEYSPSSAYSVGAFVYHDGNIYQCTTAIADGGEAWNAAHWELRKLDDFFTNSNSLLTGIIESKTIGKADQSDLDALAAKVDAANAALEEVA